MTAAITALLFLSSARTAERTVTLTPSDDVWVYPHASDPANDPFLRVWGTDGKSVPTDGEHAEFSYGYLRFDLKNVLKGHLKQAHLILTHAPAQGWTLETALANPVEIRQLSGDFDEKTWTYEKTAKVAPNPSADGLIGQGSPDKLPAEGKSALFDIDLLKGASFAKLLDAALNTSDPHLNLALCSKVDPGTLGRSSVYKFYSKDNPDAKVQPTLKLTFED